MCRKLVQRRGCGVEATRKRPRGDGWMGKKRKPPRLRCRARRLSYHYIALHWAQEPNQPTYCTTPDSRCRGIKAGTGGRVCGGSVAGRLAGRTGSPVQVVLQDDDAGTSRDPRRGLAHNGLANGTVFRTWDGHLPLLPCLDQQCVRALRSRFIDLMMLAAVRRVSFCFVSSHPFVCLFFQLLPVP